MGPRFFRDTKSRARTHKYQDHIGLKLNRINGRPWFFHVFTGMKVQVYHLDQYECRIPVRPTQSLFQHPHSSTPLKKASLSYTRTRNNNKWKHKQYINFRSTSYIEELYCITSYKIQIPKTLFILPLGHTKSASSSILLGHVGFIIFIV